MVNKEQDKLNKIIGFTKRRGFVFPSSDIYGGFGSVYDFGPLGVLMKNNIKKAWWDQMTKTEDDVVGIDSAILMNPRVWEASGHLGAGFADELVECKKCHHRFRKDFLEKNKCPDCGGSLTESKKFNLMMKTFVGPLEDESSVAYLRAETCQGIYVNFKNVMQSMRLRPPFGIAQIGKSFRNEITPKNFIFRTREFEQMEMQWFCDKKDASKLFDYWLDKRLSWYYDLGIAKKNLRVFKVPKKDLAHYAVKAADIEYKFPFGWKEIEGIHNRGDWDLRNHSKVSGEDLSVEGKYPHVIETSVGADRSFFAFLSEAYNEIEGGRGEKETETETVLNLDPSIAPIKAAVLPLVKNKKEIVVKAKEVYDLLKKDFHILYDESAAIGRRYRRQDEIGTPYCVTVDFETLDDDSVTVRNRDTMSQDRVKISDLTEYINIA